MEQYKIFLKIISANLYSFKSLIGGLIFIIFFFVYIDSFFEKFINRIEIRALIYILIIIIWLAFWLIYRFKLPRNKKNNVGFIVAIFSENEIERQKLKLDFVWELKKNFQQEQLKNSVDIIFIKNHFAEKINDATDVKKEIEKVNKKIKGHFYIWGRIKKCLDKDSKEKYFLNLQGYVVHRPIHEDLSKEISKDFSVVLPSEINFSNTEFRGFEISAKVVHIAAKYIMGLAAYVSGDPELAYQLHQNLKERFKIYKPLPNNLKKIHAKIPLLISQETYYMAIHCYDNGDIKKAKEFLEKSIIENNKNYGSWLLKAILDFKDGNISESFKSIANAEKTAGQNSEWRYSKAFLYFWTEDYDKALKVCQKIKSQKQNLSINFDSIRNFNLEVLKNNDKPQIYFWMGYINYFMLNNPAQALIDFEKFDELFKGNIITLKNKSKAYISEIKNTMEIK